MICLGKQTLLNRYPSLATSVWGEGSEVILVVVVFILAADKDIEAGW